MTERSTMRIDDLDTPVLLIEADAFERNMARMGEIAASAGIACRPHAKAHKSPLVAGMQKKTGAVGICCAKLGEAEVMVAAGIDDILITTEVVGRGKLLRLMALAQSARIGVVVDNEENIDELARAAQTAGVRLDVLVEVDVGQRRCGVAPGAAAAVLAERIRDSRWLRFRGLQGYQGAIQMTADYATRRQQVKDALDKLLETAEHVRKAGHAIEVLTGGGTGSVAIDIALGGLTELQPGSYLFMDAKYAAIEWENRAHVPFENALFVLGTVISRPAYDRAIVDVGLKAASSDGGPPMPVGLPGASFAFAGDEHGQLSFDGKPCPLALGAKIRLIPSHCDTTVNLYDHFIVGRGEHVEDVWEIAARGRVQ
ncbi:MAG: DSD1 family PLP-dependent enzyme [Alphaproteobacteria bacterium]|nr:DSD1 family PLP-dependent enzyme [Alphaproteobacteria bacterium]